MVQLRHTRKEKSKKDLAQQFVACKEDHKKTSDTSDC